VVLAVGVGAMQKLVAANPALGRRPEFRAIMNMSSLDVMATRLFFDRLVRCACVHMSVHGGREGGWEVTSKGYGLISGTCGGCSMSLLIVPCWCWLARIWGGLGVASAKPTKANHNMSAVSGHSCSQLSMCVLPLHAGAHALPRQRVVRL
jgi:hypothetical protein